MARSFERSGLHERPSSTIIHPGSLIVEASSANRPQSRPTHYPQAAAAIRRPHARPLAWRTLRRPSDVPPESHGTPLGVADKQHKIPDLLSITAGTSCTPLSATRSKGYRATASPKLTVASSDNLDRTIAISWFGYLVRFRHLPRTDGARMVPCKIGLD